MLEEYLYELIKLLNSLNENEVSLSILKALKKHSSRFEEFNTLARIFFEVKDYDESIYCTEKALELSPSDEVSLVTVKNLINVYNNANYPENAMKFITQLEKILPNDAEITLQKSYSFFLLNCKDKAEELLHYALDNFKDMSDENKLRITFNLGTYYMKRDEFQKGMKAFLIEGKKLKIWENKESNYVKNKLSQTFFWEGENISGKDLILVADAGIGDEFINIRFCKYLREKGINPLWYTTRKDLADVFKRNGFEVISDLENIPYNAHWSYPMRLPIYLNLEYKDLWYGPYISADEKYIEKWKLNKDKINIGLRWQGNPGYEQDLHRTLPIDELYENIKHIDANFHSLQKEASFEKFIDHDKDLDTWDDTLALIENLDLVITSCTSIAHASCSMGKKTIVIIPISEYYVWSNSWGRKTPWYGDNIIVLRQTNPRSWVEPIQELKGILDDFLKAN